MHQNRLQKAFWVSKILTRISHLLSALLIIYTKFCTYLQQTEPVLEWMYTENKECTEILYRISYGYGVMSVLDTWFICSISNLKLLFGLVALEMKKNLLQTKSFSFLTFSFMAQNRNNRLLALKLNFIHTFNCVFYPSWKNWAETETGIWKKHLRLHLLYVL